VVSGQLLLVHDGLDEVLHADVHAVHRQRGVVDGCFELVMHRHLKLDNYGRYKKY